MKSYFDALLLLKRERQTLQEMNRIGLCLSKQNAFNECNDVENHQMKSYK